MRFIATLYLFVCGFQVWAEDTLTFRRLSVNILTGPAILFEDGGGLSGHAGIRLHTDLNESYFVQLEHRAFLASSKTDEELLFASDPFTPGKFVSYTRKNSYRMSSVQMGYYFAGYGSDPLNLYMGVGIHLLQGQHEFRTEPYERSDYEPFPEDFSKSFSLISGSYLIGFNNLVSPHIGLFAEAQLNLSLGGERLNIPDNLYESPAGHFLSLNLGLRFYPFRQEFE